MRQILKKQKYFSLTNHQPAEKVIFVFGCKKRQKKDQSEFAAKAIGIIVTIIFI